MRIHEVKVLQNELHPVFKENHLYKFFDFLCKNWVLHNMESDRATFLGKKFSGIFVLNTTTMEKNCSLSSFMRK